MYDRFEVGGAEAKAWSDGYDNDPVGTATHLAVRQNVPSEPDIVDETDFVAIDGDVAYLYARQVTTAHGDHNHVAYIVICDEFGDEGISHGVEADDLALPGTRKMVEDAGLTLAIGDPDQIPVDVPSSDDDFEVDYRLHGYGLKERDGRPVIVFSVSEDSPTPVRWFPPLTHLINYAYGETKEESVQRLGVLNTRNEILGGWSGEDGYRLVKELADHEAYDIAVRTVRRDELGENPHAPDYEPAFLGEITYGIGGEYTRVESGAWRDSENEDGVTPLGMWREQMEE